MLRFGSGLFAQIEGMNENPLSNRLRIVEVNSTSDRFDYIGTFRGWYGSRLDSNTPTQFRLSALTLGGLFPSSWGSYIHTQLNLSAIAVGGLHVSSYGLHSLTQLSLSSMLNIVVQITYMYMSLAVHCTCRRRIQATVNSAFVSVYSAF